jgi:hypothetical protein
VAPKRDASSTESQIDELYELPPEEFTAARDRLAKRLREEGNTDESKEVKSLRRPTVPAWAVNRIVRLHSDSLRALLGAGEDLRRAQQRALSGVKGTDLREATDRRRQAVKDLVEEAQTVLDEAGRLSTQHVEAVQATLEAASVDEAAAAQVQEGRLSKELPPPSGFGDVAGLALVPGARGGKEPTTEKDRQADERAKRQREKQKQEARQAKEEADRLEREARNAEREAFRVEQEAARARTEAAKLRKLADQARQKAERYSRA